MVWVGYSHQLKTESRLLVQRELHVCFCPYMCCRGSSRGRQTDLSVMLALGESLSGSAKWWPFGSFAMTGVCLGTVLVLLFFFFFKKWHDQKASSLPNQWRVGIKRCMNKLLVKSCPDYNLKPKPKPL